MINLDEQRPNPLHVLEIRKSVIHDVDLTTIQIGDWLEGFGTIDSYTIIGFLKQAGRIGLCLAKRSAIDICRSPQ